jgi:AcrR family transcriptional regulator
MARPYRMQARAQSVEETRGRIIAAATRLFGERPFDLVSFAEVARESGIGIATVVRQFETKERLFAAAVTAARNDLELGTANTPAGDPAAAVHTAVANYERYGDAIVGLIAQEQRVPQIGAVIQHGRNEHRAWVSRVFATVLGRRRGRQRLVRFAQLMAATDVVMWKLLRRDLRLSRRETQHAMLEMVEALCR